MPFKTDWFLYRDSLSSFVQNLSLLSQVTKPPYERASFDCSHCDKTFRTEDALLNHVDRTHLTCNICAKVCKSFEELEAHNVESHVCHVCKKSFISKEEITRHLIVHQ